MTFNNFVAGLDVPFHCGNMGTKSELCAIIRRNIKLKSIKSEFRGVLEIYPRSVDIVSLMYRFVMARYIVIPIFVILSILLWMIYFTYWKRRKK